MGAFLDKPKTEKSSDGATGTNFSYGLSAMQGWRIDMEDAHSSHLSIKHPFENWSFFGIYDGHAGSAVSEICSKRLLNTIINTSEFQSIELNEKSDPINLDKVKEGIRKGFLNLDHEIGISTEVINGEDKSGSTAVTAFLTPKYIIFANCGDSRGILVRSEAVHFYTEDHKPMNPIERERIQKAGGTVMIQRINGSLAVSRSLGDFDYKRTESRGPTEQLVSPEPEITIIDRDLINDQFIVLACDGIWDVMSNDELAEFINYRLLRVSDLSKICEEVIDTCLYKGSRDNMSLIIITNPSSPKYDTELAALDTKLNEELEKKIVEFCEKDISDMDINSLLLYLQKENLKGLPPNGLSFKRYIIDKKFDELSKDKKTQNNSSESNHIQSVLSMLTGSQDNWLSSSATSDSPHSGLSNRNQDNSEKSISACGGNGNGTSSNTTLPNNSTTANKSSTVLMDNNLFGTPSVETSGQVTTTNLPQVSNSNNSSLSSSSTTTATATTTKDKQPNSKK